METKVSPTKMIVEPGRPEIEVIRTVDAPASLVYRAFAEPALIEQWLGPKKYSVEVESMDLTFGGTYRFINRGPDGEFVFRGVFHHIDPMRLVRTFEWEGMPGHISLESVEFVEHDGKTDIINKSVFLSVEDRDGMLDGMEEGMNEVYERLDELLEKLKNE